MAQSGESQPRPGGSKLSGNSPSPTPALVAHRGYAARYPENTMPALEAAIAAGARFIEFDVHVTADGVPVLLHDENLQRTTGIDAPVTDLDSDAVLKLCAGEAQRFGDAFQDVRIASLAQAVVLFRAHSALTAFVEIKPGSVRRFGPRAVMDAALEQLRPISSQCTIISFEEPALRIAEKDGGFATGWIIRAWDDQTRRRAEAMSPRFLLSDHRIVPKDLDRYWPGPWQWVMYDVTTAEHALALAARGARFVETMAIGELLRHPLFTSPAHGRDV